VYTNIGKTFPTAWASTILGVIAIFVTTPIYVSFCGSIDPRVASDRQYFYRNGERIRLNSKFASKIAEEREKEEQEDEKKQTRPQHREYASSEQTRV
jgi:hypothetical protein